MEIERRFIPVEGLEVRTIEGEMSIAGVTAVIGQESQDLGGFTEIIEAGAFDEAVATSDIRALFNHNPDFVLGRNLSGTLELEIREDGLHYKVPKMPKTRADVFESIQRGDVTGNSFAFTVAEDRYEKRDDGRTVRVISKFGELFDVGPVVYPAYSQTVVSTRALAAIAAPTADASNIIEAANAATDGAEARRRKLAIAEAEG
jgi:uncharacterized protein